MGFSRNLDWHLWLRESNILLFKKKEVCMRMWIQTCPYPAEIHNKCFKRLLRSAFVSHFLVVEVFPLKNFHHHLTILWTADLNLYFHVQSTCQGSNKSNQAKQNASLWHVCFKSVSEVQYSFNNGSKVPWQMARSTFIVPWAPLTFWYFYHTGISTDPSLAPVLWTEDFTSTARHDTVPMEFLLMKTHPCTY